MLEIHPNERVAAADPTAARTVGLEAAALVGVAPAILDALRSADILQAATLSAADWAFLAIDAERRRRTRELAAVPFGRGAWAALTRAIDEENLR